MPFWAWNGRLEPKELRRQIRTMKEMGLGGFFMHSRVGLDTPYLSEEWFRCVRACVDEARAQGMSAWLYDEDRWPSGAAGGLVTKTERFRKRSLLMEVLPPGAVIPRTDDLVAAFTARVAGSAARDVERIPDGKKPKGPAAARSILVFRVKVDALSPWYNGFTYLDTLSAGAVKRFLDVTHEQYAGRFAPDFGKTIPGIFSDEPNHGSKLDKNDGMPWTDGLLRAFRKRHGYDLVPHLPEIFLDVDGLPMTPARLHYHDCVTALFVDSFARQIGEWCGKHGLLFTGHVLAEDPLSHQTNAVGSAMRFYEHMQAPGMDLLTERWRSYTAAKQVSSAARQFGRKWRLSETYGCTGWDFPLAGHKALGDWQAALGINLRCQHLYWYTMAGQAKRDYPAPISPQSPWWELYGHVEDYFERLFSVLTRGKEVRDLLVIHPIESMWSMVRKGWLDQPRVKKADEAFTAFEAELLAAHIDFDYGDEDILSRKARVRKTGGRAELLVGEAVYRAVLIPPLATVRAATIALLSRYLDAGGPVVCAGDLPAFIDGARSGSARSFARRAERAAASGPGPAAAVEKYARRLSIADDEGREICAALHLLREDAAAYHLFVCNTGVDIRNFSPSIFEEPRVLDRTLAYPSVKIRGFKDCRGAPIELDLETGAVYEADAGRDADGRWVITTSLPALASRLFHIPRKAGGKRHPRHTVYAETREIPFEPKGWSFSLSEPNVLVLDRPRYRIGAGSWRAPAEILRVDREVRAHLGIPARGGAMVQPWARKADPGGRTARVDLRYDFNADAVPGSGVHLAIERPELYKISVNGHLLCPEMETGWWVDPSLRMLAVDPALFRTGENRVLLSTDIGSGHPGLEILYLLGDFGVKLQDDFPRMTALPETLDVGDWTSQGLAFYSGSVTYRRSLALERAADERVFIRVPEYLGTAVRVLVDGAAAGAILWEPNEADITFPGIGTRPVEIGIEVMGHRRNSHGPLHLVEKRPIWTGPAQFASTGKEWTDTYRLVPCGLMAPPVVSVRRSIENSPSR